MEFGSIQFLYFFFPFFFLIYYLLKEKWRNLWLCIGSIIFVIYGRNSFIVYFLIMTGFTFFALSNFNHLPKNISKKKMVIWTIFLELLIWFFFIRNMRIEKLIIYPICYMIILLSNIETLLDFYKNNRKSPTFLHYLLYASCFSKLLFGPVLSYYDMEMEIKKRNIIHTQMINGCFQFLRGLFENVLLIGMLVELKEALLIQNSSMLSAWTLVIVTMLQVVLFMMSYSNMSSGLSKMLGFHLKEETNNPLCLPKMKYFFSSWHYSISNFWNKHLKIKFPFLLQMSCFMLFISACYGLNYPIALWFLWIGFGICIEELCLSKKEVSKKILMIIHFIFMTISFTFLVKSNILDTWQSLLKFPLCNHETWYFLKAYAFILFVSFCVVFEFGKKITYFLEKIPWYPIIRIFFYSICLWLTLIALISGVSSSVWLFRI